jgi:type IV pilus assembly protein PilP
MTNRLALIAVVAITVAGCGGEMDDLLAYVDEVKARRGGRIEPLPQIKPYETFTYRADNLRSPFLPDSPAASASPTGPRPDARRSKEFLEQFPLDTLIMVGTLAREGRTYGLLQTQDGLVHRVLPGNYVGQNDGRIVAVNDAAIDWR